MAGLGDATDFNMDHVLHGWWHTSSPKSTGSGGFPDQMAGTWWNIYSVDWLNIYRKPRFLLKYRGLLLIFPSSSGMNVVKLNSHGAPEPGPRTGGSGWGGWDGDHFGTMIYWKCAVGVEDIFRSVDITGEMESPRGYKGYKTNKTGRGGSKWCLQPGSGLQSWVAMIRYLDFAPGWFKFSELVDFALESQSSRFAGIAVVSFCVYSSSMFFSLGPQHCVVGYTAAMLDSNQRCVRRTTYDMTIGLSGLMNHNRIRVGKSVGKKNAFEFFNFVLVKYCILGKMIQMIEWSCQLVSRCGTKGILTCFLPESPCWRG